MARYQALVFDLDGTLLDTIADLGEAVNYALRQRDLPLHTLDEYRAMVGNGVRKLVERALPVISSDSSPVISSDSSPVISSDSSPVISSERSESRNLLDACLADFMSYYESHIDVHTAPYAGMPELLQELSDAGVALAVASNKFQSGAEYLVTKLFPGIPFVAVLGNREGFPLKPDPAIVETVLEKAGVDRSAAALVGDSATDMKTAANAGVPGIAVAWGYQDMAGYPVVARTVAELRALLLPQ